MYVRCRVLCMFGVVFYVAFSLAEKEDVDGVVNAFRVAYVLVTRDKRFRRPVLENTVDLVFDKSALVLLWVSETELVVYEVVANTAVVNWYFFLAVVLVEQVPHFIDAAEKYTSYRRALFAVIKLRYVEKSNISRTDFAVIKPSPRE